MYNNIIEIYERMYLSIDELNDTPEFEDGFRSAVFMLGMQLKKLEHINSQIEIRDLKAKIDKLSEENLKLNDRIHSLIGVHKKNKIVAGDIAVLTNGNKPILNKVQMEWGIKTMFFLTDANIEDWPVHLKRIEALLKSNTLKHPNEIRMQYFKDQNIYLQKI